MARSGSQKQPAVYRSSSVILPYAGEDGLGDLEAESELFFDVSRVFLTHFIGLTVQADECPQQGWPEIFVQVVFLTGREAGGL
jgi:hypothetical protein